LFFFLYVTVRAIAMQLPARVLVLCIALVLVLVPVSESAKVQEPTEFVEEDGKKIPVFKATNPEDYDDSDVVVLTKDNFTHAINNNKNILVEFYAPWCGHCKQLKPEYGEAAERLKKSHPEVVLAKFDAVAEGAEAIAKEYDIKGFPTMKWFVDGTPHPKDCQVREAQEIIRWVAKRTGPPLKPVVHKGDMDIIKSKDTRYAVVGFFDDIDSDAFKTFATLASHDDRFDFYSVLDKAIAKEEGVSKMPAVVFYRNFDEPKLTYDKPITADDLADAVRANSRPRLIPMTEETAPIIFENELPKLFLFRPGTALADFTQAPSLAAHTTI
jgi:protein disulfide-isomerase A1